MLYPLAGHLVEVSIMMLTQPTKLNGSSFNIELKSLLIALAVIFLVNTPLNYVKSQKLEGIAEQTQLISQTISARQLAVQKAINLSQLNIVQSGKLSTENFQNLTQLFLSDQQSITAIELKMAKGEIPDCSQENSKMGAKKFSTFHEQTLYLPKQQKIDFYQPICFANKFYAFLYLQIDLYQLMALQIGNTSVINYEGQVLSSSDSTLQAGDILANQYPEFWRELTVSDKPGSVQLFS